MGSSSYSYFLALNSRDVGLKLEKKEDDDEENNIQVEKEKGRSAYFLI